jgi:hypothetical protein
LKVWASCVALLSAGFVLDSSALATMFPSVGSQILSEPDSPEDFQVMEVKNVSRDGVRVSCFEGIASAAGERERISGISLRAAG